MSDNSSETKRLIKLYGNDSFKDKIETSVSERFKAFNQILVIDKDDILVIPIAAGFSVNIYELLIDNKKDSAFAVFFIIINNKSYEINSVDALSLISIQPFNVAYSDLISLNLETKALSLGPLEESNTIGQWNRSFKRGGNNKMLTRRTTPQL